MTKLGYDELHLLGDFKLVLGYLTVAIAGILFYLDKKYTFAELFNVTAGSVVVYFIISSLLYLVNHQNKNVKYIGYKKEEKITVAGWTDKYNPTYNIEIKVNGEVVGSGELLFGEFFDVGGYYQNEEFGNLVKGVLERKNQ